MPVLNAGNSFVSLSSSSTSASPISAQMLLRFSPLIKALEQLKTEGRDSPAWCTAADTMRKNSRSSYTGRFLAYLQEAEAAGVVKYGGKSHEGSDWVKLTEAAITSKPQLEHHTQVDKLERTTLFAPLLKVLREEKVAGRERAGWCQTAESVKKVDWSAFQTGSFAEYVTSAVSAGVVRKGGSGLGQWIELVEAGAT